jgi:hypothetical protein
VFVVCTEMCTVCVNVIGNVSSSVTSTYSLLLLSAVGYCFTWSHWTTNTLQDSPGRGIGPAHRPPRAKHNIHRRHSFMQPDWIQTRNPNKQADLGSATYELGVFGNLAVNVSFLGRRRTVLTIINTTQWRHHLCPFTYLNKNTKRFKHLNVVTSF